MSTTASLEQPLRAHEYVQFVVVYVVNAIFSIQVSIGTIVRGGPADLSGQLQRGDEIHKVDGINVVGATHRRVISLMGNAGVTGEVVLGIHRDPAKTGSTS